MTERVRDTGGGRPLYGAFTFALIAAFSLLALLIVVLGARVYRSVEEASRRNYDTRTALSYVAGKVRAGDTEGGIFVSEEGDVSALVLRAAYGERTYHTYIYCSDGALYELFTAAENGFTPGSGSVIASAAGFSPVLEGRVLRITLTDQDGRARTMRLYLQAGGGEAGA